MRLAIVFLLRLFMLAVEASHFHGAMTAWRVQENDGNGNLLVRNFTMISRTYVFLAMLLCLHMELIYRLQHVV